jgi:hypothetical protein
MAFLRSFPVIISCDQRLSMRIMNATMQAPCRRCEANPTQKHAITGGRKKAFDHSCIRLQCRMSVPLHKASAAAPRALRVSSAIPWHTRPFPPVQQIMHDLCS